jgi:hypothetical protein
MLPSWLRIPFCLVATLLAATALAQVEHKELFKPTAVIEIIADPAADAEVRRAAFAARNSPENLARLADELFGMMRLDWEPEDPEFRDLYRAAVNAYRSKAPTALEAYKQFFLRRAIASGAKGRDPKARTFIEFFSEPDGLMQGKARVAALTEDYPAAIANQGIDAMLNYYRAGMLDERHVLLEVVIGEPGEVNWTWSLPNHFGPTWHMPRDRRFLSFAYGANPDFFTSLVGAYVASGDTAYLLRWAAYTDDFLINFIPDARTTTWADELNWTNIPGPGLDTIIFAARERPQTIDALPAATLARIVLHTWNTRIPLEIQRSRSGGPNRRLTMYGRQLNHFYFQFPELAERSAILRQRRRTIEDHARVAIHPDGTDQILAIPYFDHIYSTPPADIRELRGHPEAAWLDERWVQELRRTQNLVGAYMLRALDPGGRHPGHRDPFRNIFEAKGRATGPTSFEKLVPEMIARPENRAIFAWHAGERPASVPIRSFSFPYGGYSFIWSDWSEQPQFMHLTSQRPGTRNRWRFNNNISLTAYGQLMLFYSAEDYVLEVDGIGGLAGVDRRAMPELSPQPHRWVSSDHFDLVEGTMTDDSRQRLDPTTGRTETIGPVTHHRQIMFVRDAGAWIVTDRIAGDRSHDYRLLWPFRGDHEFNVGSKDIRDRLRTPPADSHLNGYRRSTDFEFDDTRKAIRTTSPHIPNLSILHASDRRVMVPDGDFVQHDWRFGNALCTGPRIAAVKDAVVASLLFPRKDADDELAEYTSVDAKGIAGFDAVTKQGHRFSYRASGQKPIALAIGDLAITGESLLLATNPGDVTTRGIALGAMKFIVNDVAHETPGPDFSFEHRSDGSVHCERIHRPLEMVRIAPGADRFIDSLRVTLSHPEPDVTIYYTLDGSLPDLTSPQYSEPIVIHDSTWVTAVAVRPGVVRLVDSTDSIRVSIPHWAIYEKEPLRRAQCRERPADARPGLKAVYKETVQPISMLNFRSLPTTQAGVASKVFDLSLRAGADPSSNYGLAYEGYLDVAERGIYEFHAPAEFVSAVVETWYDLRLLIDGEEWYPATRRQNFGSWSVPLDAGSHRIEVHWVDQRPSMGSGLNRESFQRWNGIAPVLEISGPDLPRQPIPAASLWHTPQTRATESGEMSR